MEKPLISVKTAVIGAGHWGKNLVHNFYQLGALSAVCDSSEKTRSDIQAQYPSVKVFSSYSECLNSALDAVAIASPAHLHAEMAELAFLANKHVFVEKPMTLNVADAKKLIDLAKEKNRILMVGHLLLYQPAIHAIKKLIESEKLGPLMSLHQVRCNFGKIRKIENVLWSFGVHDLAVLLYLIGKKPIKIESVGQTLIQPEIEDDVYIHLKFPNQIQAHLHSSWLWPEKNRSLTLLFAKGMVTYDESTQKVIVHHKSITSDLKYLDHGTEVLFEGAQEPLKIELEHFIDCILSSKQPISDGLSGLEVIEILNEASLILENQKNEKLLCT